MKQRPSFSVAVRNFEHKKRNQRLIRLMGIMFALALSAILLAASWSVYRSTKRKDAANAPTWAEFTVKGAVEYSARGMDPVSGAPTSLLINGERWNLLRVDEIKDHTVSGETYCRNHLIVYLVHESQMELRTTLWHEIFHAGGCGHGGDVWWNSIDPTGKKHPGIVHLSEFMVDFTRTNPQYMVWAQ